MMRNFIMISCKEATKWSSIYEDGKLALMDKLRYKMHISLCKVCARFDSQIKLIIEEFKRIDSDITLQPHEKENLKDIIIRRLNID